MTYDNKKFSHLSSSCPKSIITNANGVSSPVVGIGTIPLSPFLSINNVLFISSLNCNLISVSQLTKSHDCVTIFFPLTVFFRTSIPRRRLAVVNDMEACTIWTMGYNNLMLEHWFTLWAIEGRDLVMAYTIGTPLIWLSSEIISILVYWLSSFRLYL